MRRWSSRDVLLVLVAVLSVGWAVEHHQSAALLRRAKTDLAMRATVIDAQWLVIRETDKHMRLHRLAKSE